MLAITSLIDNVPMLAITSLIDNVPMLDITSLIDNVPMLDITSNLLPHQCTVLIHTKILGLSESTQL